MIAWTPTSNIIYTTRMFYIMYAQHIYLYIYIIIFMYIHICIYMRVYDQLVTRRVQQLEAVALGGGVHDQAVGSDGAFSVFGVFHKLPTSGVALAATKSVSWRGGRFHIG